MIRRGEIDDPSSILAESHSLIGFCSYYLLRPDKAIEHYLQAIQYKNDFSGYYFNLGLIYYNLGDFSKAIVNFKKAVSLSAVESTVSKKNEQTPEAAETVNILNEGQKFIILSYEAARDYQSMLEAARSAVDENKPDKIFYYYYAGKAAAKTGEYAKAADFLNQCLILAPWHADAYRELAFSLQELHQMESADQMMQQAQTLQAAPDFQQYQKLLKIQPFLFF